MKRTAWYPASIKPVRDGWYEWRCTSLFLYRKLQFEMQDWRGEWVRLYPCPQCQWRGLAQPSERREG
jgi:hypothetical protein